MKNFIADVHLHSKCSRAVSSHMTIPTMSLWAKKKGIQLLGTGDWTHPFWFSELQKDPKETGTGLYERDGIFYILSCEISLIYSQGGKTRRIHIVVLAPSLSVVEKINAKLSKRGNLLSDGRPILGLTAKELAELIFSLSPDCFLLPAHIWTPWFSLYGSKSGFDSLEAEPAYGSDGEPDGGGGVLFEAGGLLMKGRWRTMVHRRFIVLPRRCPLQ